MVSFVPHKYSPFTFHWKRLLIMAKVYAHFNSYLSLSSQTLILSIEVLAYILDITLMNFRYEVHHLPFQSLGLGCVHCTWRPCFDFSRRIN